MFVFEALKALHGDALLLRSTNSLLMVDGGPRSVYDKTLKPRLKSLARSGQPAKINLLMVSHIDDDHIFGVLDLTEELVEAKFERRPPVAKILNLWHNSFSDDILRGASTARRTSDTHVENAMALAGLADADADFGDRIPESMRLTLASVRQGRRLRRDANLLRLKTNAEFNDKIVLRDGGGLAPKRIGQFTLGVLGPCKPQLNGLRKKWKTDLKKILKSGTPRVTALQLAAKLDDSLANLSSLVVQASASGKTALLTGDARSDHIMAAMDDIGWPDHGTWPVDLLKVPHHGSERNVTREFFSKVPARHYVISGNGKHGNPDPETFEMIFEARGSDNFELHLTYGPDELKRHPKFDWRYFKRVMKSHGGWSRLRYPGPGQSAVKIKLA